MPLGLRRPPHHRFPENRGCLPTRRVHPMTSCPPLDAWRVVAVAVFGSVSPSGVAFHAAPFIGGFGSSQAPGIPACGPDSSVAIGPPAAIVRADLAQDG